MKGLIKRVSSRRFVNLIYFIIFNVIVYKKNFQSIYDIFIKAIRVNKESGLNETIKYACLNSIIKNYNILYWQFHI